MKANDSPPRQESRLAMEPADEAGSGAQFSMVQRGDFIKPGWWHWRCRREDAAGDVAYGYVQADPLGKIIVPDTFERDR